MRFKHIRPYAVRGVVLPSTEGPISLIERPRDGLRAKLCGQSDSLLDEFDRRTALANVTLDGVFGGRGEGTIEERLAAATPLARENRERWATDAEAYS